jgi:hypothetical protein
MRNLKKGFFMQNEFFSHTGIDESKHSKIRQIPLTGIAKDTQYHFSGKGPEQSLSEVMNLLPQDILQLKQSIWLKTPVVDHKSKKESDAELRDIIAEEIRYHFQNNTLPFLGKAINEKLVEFKDRIHKDKSFFYITIKKITKKIMQYYHQEMSDDDKHGSTLIHEEIKEILDKCPKNTDQMDENHLESLIVPVFLYLHRYLPDKDMLQQFDYRDFMRFWRQMQQSQEDLDDFLQLSEVQCRYLGYRLGMHLEIFELSLADSGSEKQQTQGFDKAINDSRKDVTQTSAVIYKFTEKSGWRLHDVREDKIYSLDSLLDRALTREELLKSPKILRKLQSQLMRHFDYFSSYQEKIYVDSEEHCSESLTGTDEKEQKCPINKEEKYQETSSQQAKNPLLEFKYHDEFTKRPGPIQLAAIINKNNRGELFAVPALIDALASTKYRALVIWQQASKTKLQPIHYFIPNKNNADQECHILLFYRYGEVIISSKELETKEIKTLEENDRKLYLYFQKTKKPGQQQAEIQSIKVYAKGKMINQFTGIAGDNLIANLKALHIPLPTNQILETRLVHSQYIYQIAHLCGIKPRYRLLELKSTEPINCTAFNRKSASYGLEECRLGLVKLADLQNPEESITAIIQNHSELQGLPLVIQHSQHMVFYGRTVHGEWRLNKDLDAKAFSDLFSGELKPSLEKTIESGYFALFSNKKVPVKVYKEIADKEAHIPLSNAVLCYDVTETIKQRKRARWQERYFFLCVDAMHRATYQKNYLPWLEGLLGVNLQKYFNYGLGKRGARILSVLNQYGNDLLGDLIEIIEELHQREEPKILNYSIKVWQERLKEIDQELEKDKYPHQKKMLWQERVLLEGVLSNSQECILLPTKTLVQDSHYWKKMRDSKNALESTPDSRDFEDSKVELDSVSYVEDESRIDYSRGYDFPYREWIRIDQDERLKRAYIVWLEQKPANLVQAFDQILQEIHDRLIKLIKEKYAKEIEQGERQYVTLVIDKYFKGDDGLDSERNFIKPVTQQKEQLLFRLAESFLRRSCFKEFANNWNWDALKSDFVKMKRSRRRENNFFPDNLNYSLAEQNIDEKLTFGDEDKLVPSKIHQNYSENLVNWLVEYLPKDENLAEILGYNKSSKSETEKWAQSFAGRLLASGIEQCSFREVTDPYAGNTLLHYALLCYKKHRNNSLQRDNLLAIIHVLFSRDACFSSVNAKRQHPLQFSQLLEILGEEQDHKLLADYQLLDMGFKNLPVFSELSYLTITKYHNYLHNSCQDLSKSWYFWSIKKGKAHRLTLLRHFLNGYIPLVYTQNDATLEIELVKVSNNQAYWPSGILGLGHGGYSSLMSQTQSVENLIRVKSSAIAYIYMVMLCSERQFSQLLYDNTPWRGQGIIYLNRPKKDKINACWLLNGLWNHLQLKPKNGLDFKNLESNGLPAFPWKEFSSPETFTINKNAAFDLQVARENEALVKEIAKECGCTSKRPSQEPKLQLFRSNIAKIDDKHSPLTTKPSAGEWDDGANTVIREGSSLVENPQQNRGFEELEKCKENIEKLASEISAYRTKASETDQKIQQLESKLRQQNGSTTTDTTYSPRLIGQPTPPAPMGTPSTVLPGSNIHDESPQTDSTDDADDEESSGSSCIIS